MEDLTVGDVVDALLKRFPLDRAESWDRVGLLVGDRDATARRVWVALDADTAAVETAVTNDYDLLLTHHPPFLEAPGALTPEALGPAFRALREGLAVVSLHTNLDRSPAGARALADALGLPADRPLEQGSEAMALCVAYVPRPDADHVRSAMSEAGAGRLGEYEGCAFQSPGTGRFQPLEEADPHAAGGVEDEERVEMLCPEGDAERVLRTAVRAHPYEEPVVFFTPVRRARSRVALGTLGDLERPLSLGDLAERVGARLDSVAEVWGDPDTRVETVACAGGSGGSLIRAALRAGADCLVTGEVRYHDAIGALEQGLAVIAAGHDSTEFPLVRVLGHELHRLYADDLHIHVADMHTRRHVSHGRSR